MLIKQYKNGIIFGLFLSAKMLLKKIVLNKLVTRTFSLRNLTYNAISIFNVLF